MNFFLRVWAIFQIALRRLLAQRWLALATELGLVASLAIIMSIPIYSDAVYYRILREELGQTNEQSNYRRPPFGFMFRYSGSIYGPKQWEDIEAVDAYLSGPALAQIRLPIQETTRYFRTDSFRLFPKADVESGVYSSARDPLEWVAFASAADIDQHVKLAEGAFPSPASADPNEPVEVMVSKVMADELGMQAGEDYVTFRTIETESGQRTVQVPVRVTGIWEPNDPADEYWFYPWNVFETQLFIPEASFRGRMTSLLNDEIDQMVWYWRLDGSEVSADDADLLVARIDQIRARAATLLPNTKLDISPYDGLRDYQRASGYLNILLYAFAIPIVCLLLAFIGLVVGLSVGRQRNEIAVLRSRGATAFQIVGIATLEALMLAGLALAIAAPLAISVAQTIGSTKSFLNFTLSADLRTQLTASALRFGLVAVSVTLMAQVLPSLSASRHTIVSYKQELARTVRAPWWQRAWLDILLLIPAFYGVYLLRQQGSIITESAAGASGDMFDNPLFFLLPSLTAFALTLLVLRLLPLVMRLLSWIAARTSSVGFLLATRYLARDPEFYTTPLILLMLTLSLSVFTASLAQTLDNHLYDQNYYRVGADARLVELGASSAISGGFGAAGGPAAAQGADAAAEPTSEEEEIGEPEWVFIPVSEHLKVKEILAATRVGEFGGRVQIGDEWKASSLMGVDRVDFPKVAYWRHDFAAASLGALMNSLAIASDGILAERRFMRQNGLRVGDQVQVRLNATENDTVTPMKIMGDFEYFPTWYSPEEEKPLFIANLDTLFEMSGGEQPYDVWVKTDPEIDYAKMVDDLRDIEITLFDYDVAAQRIATAQRRPERQGLFGVLSVGFLASALLTVLGFLLYALFSFRRRFIELGTLRAIGLSASQLAIFLVSELAFLILLGLGAGTWIGILISQFFIPYLQIGTDVTANIPPFTVDVAWQAVGRLYILFGGLFVVALGVLMVLLTRMKVFQAIKLGETV
jgi:putative ABC transport system permease protein